VIDHPDEVDLDTSKDMISKSLMEYPGLMPFNVNPHHVESVGGDLEPAVVPYIITKELSSHQRLNGHIITTLSPDFMTPTSMFEKRKKGHAHEHLNSKSFAPLYLDVTAPNSFNQV